ncbi:MAG: 2-oxoacid:acceptor oxidoreductase family protein [Candidatus Tectomicrobia bacterium]|uniref:2-oxoacid:acceptor oxidoreductase family protein n=1 Tax=Tectimicrobiota bacterium TaxID=2528274 RepID=A0A932CNZ5_UNCTE|nr:2-oxoacid:acceptor oxidoreductase family protein [Candidatus Tectomicrobia bacterium]
MSEPETSWAPSSRAQTLRVRLHGRGGQGAVTAANILALAAHLAGHQVRANPLYGPERRGAPVASFLRISPVPFRLKCQI